MLKGALLALGNPVRPVPEFGPATPNSDPEAERQDGPSRPAAREFSDGPRRAHPELVETRVRQLPGPDWEPRKTRHALAQQAGPRNGRLGASDRRFQVRVVGELPGRPPPPSWLRLKTFFRSLPAFPAPASRPPGPPPGATLPPKRPWLASRAAVAPGDSPSPGARRGERSRGVPQAPRTALWPLRRTRPGRDRAASAAGRAGPGNGAATDLGGAHRRPRQPSAQAPRILPGLGLPPPPAPSMASGRPAPVPAGRAASEEDPARESRARGEPGPAAAGWLDGWAGGAGRGCLCLPPPSWKLPAKSCSPRRRQTEEAAASASASSSSLRLRHSNPQESRPPPARPTRVAEAAPSFRSAAVGARERGRAGAGGAQVWRAPPLLGRHLPGLPAEKSSRPSAPGGSPQSCQNSQVPRRGGRRRQLRDAETSARARQSGAGARRREQRPSAPLLPPQRRARRAPRLLQGAVLAQGARGRQGDGLGARAGPPSLKRCAFASRPKEAGAGWHDDPMAPLGPASSLRPVD